jgi:hypothetical protein
MVDFLWDGSRKTLPEPPVHAAAARHINYNNMLKYTKLVGFGCACAPVRCAHLSFWAHCHTKQGRCMPPPPPHRSFAAPPKIKHPIELRCTLLSYAAFNRATPHPIWATLHHKSYDAPSKLSCTLLSYAAPFWATLHPTELRLSLNELRGPSIAASLILPTKYIQRKPRKMSRNKMLLFRPELGLPGAYIVSLYQRGFDI